MNLWTRVVSIVKHTRARTDAHACTHAYEPCRHQNPNTTHYKTHKQTTYTRKEPENEVNPVVKVGRHIVRLQSHAMYLDKPAGIPFGPGRQGDTIKPVARLELAQIEARVVGEHFGQIEELRHNLLHVGHAPSRGRAFPGMLDVVEETICVVEFPA